MFHDSLERRVKDRKEKAKRYIDLLLTEQEENLIHVPELGEIKYISLLIRTLQLDPSLARAYHILGVYFLKTKSNQTIFIKKVGSFTARSAFLKAIELDNHLGKAFSGLALSLDETETLVVPGMGDVTVGKKDLWIRALQLDETLISAYDGLLSSLQKTEPYQKSELIKKRAYNCPKSLPNNESDLFCMVCGQSSPTNQRLFGNEDHNTWYVVKVHPQYYLKFELSFTEEMLHIDQMGEIYWSNFGDVVPDDIQDLSSSITQLLEPFSFVLSIDSDYNVTLDKSLVFTQEKLKIYSNDCDIRYFANLLLKQKELSSFLLAQDDSNVTDKPCFYHSQFPCMTAFQYSLCTFDDTMWNTLLMYLPIQSAISQFLEWKIIATKFPHFIENGNPQRKGLKKFTYLHFFLTLAEIFCRVSKLLCADLATLVSDYCFLTLSDHTLSEKRDLYNQQTAVFYATQNKFHRTKKLKKNKKVNSVDQITVC